MAFLKMCSLKDCSVRPQWVFHISDDNLGSPKVSKNFFRYSLNIQCTLNTIDSIFELVSLQHSYSEIVL